LSSSHCLTIPISTFAQNKSEPAPLSNRHIPTKYLHPHMTWNWSIKNLSSPLRHFRSLLPVRSQEAIMQEMQVTLRLSICSSWLQIRLILLTFGPAVSQILSGTMT
jgi:hypothetical protein